MQVQRSSAAPSKIGREGSEEANYCYHVPNTEIKE